MLMEPKGSEGRLPRVALTGLAGQGLWQRTIGTSSEMLASEVGKSLFCGLSGGNGLGHDSGSSERLCYHLG